MSLIYKIYKLQNYVLEITEQLLGNDTKIESFTIKTETYNHYQWILKYHMRHQHFICSYQDSFHFSDSPQM